MVKWLDRALRSGSLLRGGSVDSIQFHPYSGQWYSQLTYRGMEYQLFIATAVETGFYNFMWKPEYSHTLDIYSHTLDAYSHTLDEYVIRSNRFEIRLNYHRSWSVCVCLHYHLILHLEKWRHHSHHHRCLPRPVDNERRNYSVQWYASAYSDIHPHTVLIVYMIVFSVNYMANNVHCTVYISQCSLYTI